MGMFDSFNIASTGLTAQRLRMDLISNNVANANTTRTTEGGPFVRKLAIFAPVNHRPFYKSPLVPERIDHGSGRGVRVVKIEKDKAPFRLVYDPTHPDAIAIGPKKGYVEMPNVNIVSEMTDLISASRSYEANITMVNNSKMMFNRALEIGRGGV
ncbi:MAG TPA: flagellar basal body rod protein FlgC [Spirochaetota bacterium]|nr:flagellar basal body rod protein FlgC [Spirochaetota bacterium]HNT11970.1 flagellar basal body rod protein FlgC [Spirochaetota bacterium]HNV46868.1 flagellar basal body rod protein FlgC [Spirochaetota bacterium]HOS40751.1 flagellar basal body rod protein FlgC [Spirochaetota bacterium]HPU88484.1 flagellar basal body rod protein FlgC [Spirochaetota bacterium]